jgi:hypothetical protein
MSTKLKTITPNSWLVITDNGDRIGLLTSINEKYTLMVKDVKRKFSSKEAVNTFFQEDVFSEENKVEDIKITEGTGYFINGYSVPWNNPYPVLISGYDLPLYTKKEHSELVFSAGYYCLGFPKMWQPAYSPKLETLKKYKYFGPYKTEEEMKQKLSKLRRQKTEE